MKSFFVSPKSESGQVIQIVPTDLASPIKNGKGRKAILTEKLYVPKEGLLTKILNNENSRIDKINLMINKVVYDSLTPIIARPFKTSKGRKKYPLLFDSKFECGNLRRAIHVFEHEYDLILNFDINTRKHAQWFFFKIQNVEKGVKYKFNIINFLKADSLFNYGMKPTIFSEYDAKHKKQGWKRAEVSDICYFQNNIKRRKNKYFYTLTFSMVFNHNSTYYLSYTYPYGYSRLYRYLQDIETNVDNKERNKWMKKTLLCKTIAGNKCFLLTITNPDPLTDEFPSPQKKKSRKRIIGSTSTCINGNIKKEISNRSNKDKPGIKGKISHPQPGKRSKKNTTRLKRKKGIVFTARVHPSETPSSFVMKGIIDFLTSNKLDAKLLRNNFVFKIVPQLNPDGCINGNTRCSLSGNDLNRKWKKPSKKLHPTIYHTKQMINKLKKTRDTVIFVDLHAHSKSKNSFIFGNPGIGLETRILPRLLNKNSPIFSFQDCSFDISKKKQNTGRVAVYKEGIHLAYSLEVSFCGSNFGEKFGVHYNRKDYERLGKDICISILDLFDPDETLKEEAKQEIHYLYPEYERSKIIFHPVKGIEPCLPSKLFKQRTKRRKQKEFLEKKKKKKEFSPQFKFPSLVSQGKSI